MSKQPTNIVMGTKGYSRAVNQFIEVSQSLDFEQANADFLSFLPDNPSAILDAGSGAGQNAAALARMGHSVVAVEPMCEFLEAAQSEYGHLEIEWIRDSLPDLQSFQSSARFDFILVTGVWHHLSCKQREQAICRFSALLQPGGRCAISLRNGPAGMGTHVYPTDSENTLNTAEKFNLYSVFHVKNQPSILKNKPLVSWSRIVIQKATG